MPPPADYELLPLDNVPDAARQPLHLRADRRSADLRLVAEYIAQGHLKYTKSEQVAMPSLRFSRQMTGGPEFFDAPTDSDLALLRTRLLVGGMAFAGEQGTGSTAGPRGQRRARAGVVSRKCWPTPPSCRRNCWSIWPIATTVGATTAPNRYKNLAAFFGQVSGREMGFLG